MPDRWSKEKLHPEETMNNESGDANNQWCSSLLGSKWRPLKRGGTLNRAQVTQQQVHSLEDAQVNEFKQHLPCNLLRRQMKSSFDVVDRSIRWIKSYQSAIRWQWYDSWRQRKIILDAASPYVTRFSSKHFCVYSIGNNLKWMRAYLVQEWCQVTTMILPSLSRNWPGEKESSTF